MQTSPFNKNAEQWLVELNNPQAEHRRDALTVLADSGTLDDELIRELKLIARGDPDAKTRSLARKVLKSRGIKILPQIAYQPGVKNTNPLLGLEFRSSFFLFPIFNFIGLVLVPLNRNIIFLVVVDLILLIYFGLTRKNVALGMVVSFGFAVVLLPVCLVLYLSWTCWPDGCPVPQ